jgi:hypothetical protein
MLKMFALYEEQECLWLNLWMSKKGTRIIVCYYQSNCENTSIFPLCRKHNKLKVLKNENNNK